MVTRGFLVLLPTTCPAAAAADVSLEPASTAEAFDA